MEWRDLHFADGLKLLPHCLLSEAFLRIDVLMLSFFVNLEILGRYSFVAFCAEGILQLPYFLKNMVTPQLARHIFQDERTMGYRTALKASLISLSLTLVLTISLSILFPIGMRLMNLAETQEINDWWKILSVGVVVYSITIPFENILYLLGFPKLQSAFLAVITSVNVLLNLVFIPGLGAMGAAMATTLSFVSGASILPLLAFLVLRKQTSLS
jgi:Na+-driven multidrug efflux pump